MSVPLDYLFAAGATALNGLLAGVNVDRSVVQMPAWQQVGVRAWAAYSRHADLGNGRIVYPLLAIGGALLSVAAAVGFHTSMDVSHPRLLSADIAAVLAVAGLLTTIGAAPRMLRLRTLGDDEEALQRMFDGFLRWGSLRALCQIGAFGANLVALVQLASAGR
jgi:hypothetical protein